VVKFFLDFWPKIFNDFGADVVFRLCPYIFNAFWFFMLFSVKVCPYTFWYTGVEFVFDFWPISFSAIGGYVVFLFQCRRVPTNLLVKLCFGFSYLSVKKKVDWWSILYLNYGCHMTHRIQVASLKAEAQGKGGKKLYTRSSDIDSMCAAVHLHRDWFK
jgi:hypothetical protein